MTYKFMQEMKEKSYIDIEGSVWYGEYTSHSVCFWSLDDCGNRGFGINITPEEIRILFFDDSPEDIIFESSEKGLEKAKQTVADMIDNICSDLDNIVKRLI